MLARAAAIGVVVEALGPDDVVVAALGYSGRELFARAGAARDRCFFCMGSMGSVLPLALGISLAQPEVNVLALEGDGSLLMNLGALATLRRYGSGRVRLAVLDNACYESTGGQPSQPDGFELGRLCAGAGLGTTVVGTEEDLVRALGDPGCRVVVIEVGPGGKPPRIDLSPTEIAERFTAALPPTRVP